MQGGVVAIIIGLDLIHEFQVTTIILFTSKILLRFITALKPPRNFVNLLLSLKSDNWYLFKNN